MVPPNQRGIDSIRGAGSWADPQYQGGLSVDWEERRWLASPYTVFQEMEDRDGHLFAALQTRKLAVMAGGWRLTAGEGPGAQEVCDWLRPVLLGMGDLESALLHCLDALGKGMALVEVEWGRVGAGIVPRRLVGHWPGDFAFDEAGELYRLEEEHQRRWDRWGISREREGQRTKAPVLLPRPGEGQSPRGLPRLQAPRTMIVHTNQGSPAQPYGVSLCLKAYWLTQFKRHTLRQWTVLNERFGTPTAVMKYPVGTTRADLDRLESLVGQLAREGGVVLPEEIGLEMLESGRSGSGQSLKELADWCNDEISKIVLGQTLTSSEGRRSGSLALGGIHDQVRREYVAADARALAATIQRTLVRWLVEWNFGQEAAVPRFELLAERQRGAQEELELDERLLRLGVPLPVGWFHQRYDRPLPQEGERSLRYDDANLYQYHLQFGVLTVNEVRQSLGLDPVKWGDQRVGYGAGGTENPSVRGGRSTGEDLPDDDGGEGGGLEGLRDRKRR